MSARAWKRRRAKREIARARIDVAYFFAKYFLDIKIDKWQLLALTQMLA